VLVVALSSFCYATFVFEIDFSFAFEIALSFSLGETLLALVKILTVFAFSITLVEISALSIAFALTCTLVEGFLRQSWGWQLRQLSPCRLFLRWL